ncbi:hypothetical protein jhhlp_003059 [Lomentospora prolificans]|uniref:Condensation domain-containing protein n=1 Tax=Lomentospora prolificans TaxID=41688 RepID=A0A2N3NFX5_9PEZI|nr:hypothetical protein jhhlp_003059 [Lomentospora prolificans]
MEQLQWRETEPGVWTRSIDEVELFYAALAEQWRGSGRTFFAMTGHITISVDAPVDWCTDMESAVDISLRHAWMALRFDHPTIGARVIYNGVTGEFTKVYRTLIDAIDERAWLDQTVVKISTGQTGIEWANSDPPCPEYPTLFVITPTPSSPTQGSSRKRIRRDLVIKSPHDIMDGIGTLMLLNNLVKHASRAYAQGKSFPLPTFNGAEIYNLSPPYKIAVGAPETPTEVQKERVEELAIEKKSASSGVELLTMPFKRGEMLPGRHQRVFITLPARDTARILQKCKDMRATVTHAFHAAIPIAVRDIKERTSVDRPVRYVNYILRNERASCAEPYNTMQHPASVYHSVSGGSLSVDLIVPAAGSDGFSEEDRNEEYQRIIEKMKDFYYTVKNDTHHAHIAPLIWAGSVPNLPFPSIGTPPVPPPNEAPSVSISSMGRIDPILPPSKGVFEVYDPWVTGEELGTGLGVFLGTYRDQLTLSAAYNDAFHDESEVLDFLNRCKEIVYRGLKI